MNKQLNRRITEIKAIDKTTRNRWIVSVAVIVLSGLMIYKFLFTPWLDSNNQNSDEIRITAQESLNEIEALADNSVPRNNDKGISEESNALRVLQTAEIKSETIDSLRLNQTISAEDIQIFAREEYTLSPFEIWIGNNGDRQEGFTLNFQKLQNSNIQAVDDIPPSFVLVNADKLAAVHPKPDGGFMQVRFLDRTLIIIPLLALVIFVLGVLHIRNKGGKNGAITIFWLSIILCIYPFAWEILSQMSWQSDYQEILTNQRLREQDRTGRIRQSEEAFIEETIEITAKFFTDVEAMSFDTGSFKLIPFGLVLLAMVAMAQEERPIRYRDLVAVLRYTILLFVALIITLPVVVVILGAIRTTPEFYARPFDLPRDRIYWEHFTEVLEDSAFWEKFKNSLLISVTSTVLVVIMSSMMAFIFARVEFRGRSVLFNILTFGLMFPLVVAILPLFLKLSELGLLDSYWGVIFPLTAFGLPGSTIILRGFFRSIPPELEDASYIDGCTLFGFFRYILIPMSRPAIIAVATLQIIIGWNDYFLSLIVLSDPHKWPLPLGLMDYQGQYGQQDTARVMGYVTLLIIPAVAFYFFTERYIVTGLTGGELKG